MTLEVLTLNIGQPQVLLTARGKTFTSAIAKVPVLEPVSVTRLGLVGDAQANQRYHGGPHKALCAYFAAHFPLWESQFSLPRGVIPLVDSANSALSLASDASIA